MAGRTEPRMFNLKEGVMEDLESGKKPRNKYSINGETRYLKNGVECRCASKRPRSAQEKAEAKERETDEHKEQEALFTTVVFTLKALFRQLGEWETWNSFARKLTITGWILCNKLNNSCCDVNGVRNFRAFVFSLGWLANPLYTRLSRQGWTVTLEWEDRCHRRANRGTDRLMIGYFYHSYANAPQVIVDTGATRADGRVEFTLPSKGFDGEALPADEVVHVYPFFTRPDRSDSSRSLYFRVREGIDEEV